MSAPRRSRRRLWWLLLVGFVVVPLVEIVLVVQVGQVIGAWWTIALLVADSLLGAWLVRREGGRAWRALRDAVRSGRMPAAELADAALILVGGTLLLTPGFATDLAGFAMILPLTRPVARRILSAALARRLLADGGVAGPRPSGFGRGSASTRESAGDVVPGEVVDRPEPPAPG